MFYIISSILFVFPVPFALFDLLLHGEPKKVANDNMWSLKIANPALHNNQWRELAQASRAESSMAARYLRLPELLV